MADSLPPVQLDGSHVILTGAAGGIGSALARQFAAAGARLTLADLQRDPLTALAAELDALAVCADVGVQRAVAALVARGRERHGEVDLLFSNAGIAGPAAGPEASDADWRSAWQVNVMSDVYAARAVLPAMLQRRRGYLASTASAAGLLTQISAAPYSVTKHAAFLDPAPPPGCRSPGAQGLLTGALAGGNAPRAARRAAPRRR